MFEGCLCGFFFFFKNTASTHYRMHRLWQMSYRFSSIPAHAEPSTMCHFHNCGQWTLFGETHVFPGIQAGFPNSGQLVSEPLYTWRNGVNLPPCATFITRNRHGGHIWGNPCIPRDMDWFPPDGSIASSEAKKRTYGKVSYNIKNIKCMKEMWEGRALWKAEITSQN